MAASSKPIPDDLLRAYVQARAAEAVGDEGRAAELFSRLASADPADPTIAQRALGGAIAAGNAPLALRIARALPAKQRGLNARLLLVADDLKERRTADALAILETPGQAPDLAFFGPLVRAWDQASRGDAAAVATINQIPVAGPLGPFVPEQRALIFAALHQLDQAEPLARQAIAGAGGRENRVRLEMAEAFRAAGDRQRALAMLPPTGRGMVAARARIAANQTLGRRDRHAGIGLRRGPPRSRDRAQPRR